MSHNYKLEDFIIVENKDTDIHERIVSVDLSRIKELPVTIVRRLGGCKIKCVSSSTTFYL